MMKGFRGVVQVLNDITSSRVMQFTWSTLTFSHEFTQFTQFTQFTGSDANILTRPAVHIRLYSVDNKSDCVSGVGRGVLAERCRGVGVSGCQHAGSLHSLVFPSWLTTGAERKSCVRVKIEPGESPARLWRALCGSEVVLNGVATITFQMGVCVSGVSHGRWTAHSHM